MANHQPIKLSRPIDDVTASLLREVDQLARAIEVPYFVGGAVARIVVLEHIFGCPPGRATLDVDIGVCLADWQSHEAFKRKLTDTGLFSAVPKNAHKLIYRPTPTDALQLDVIPFGDIEHPAASIAWPPDMDVVMNVAGFREASLSTLLVEIADDLAVPFASLPSMALLKLLAWRDRHHESKRDATDLLILVRSYATAECEDRLYGSESAMMEQYDFDIDLASAALLAKDCSLIAQAEAQRQVKEIFTDDDRFQLLMRHMAFGDRSALLDSETDSGRVRERMKAFRDAFMVRA